MKGWAIALSPEKFGEGVFLVRDSDAVLMPTRGILWNMVQIRDARRLTKRAYCSSTPGAASIWRAKGPANRYRRNIEEQTGFTCVLKRVPIEDTGAWTNDGRRYLRMQIHT